jgi:uncharacterized protein YdhG (YjbR/CyaY superfamily)
MVQRSQAEAKLKEKETFLIKHSRMYQECSIYSSSFLEQFNEKFTELVYNYAKQQQEEIKSLKSVKLKINKAVHENAIDTDNLSRYDES